MHPVRVAVGAGLVITPGMVQTEIESVETSLRSLVRDVTDSNAGDKFRKGLSDFALEWVDFKKRNEGWFTRGFGGVYAQTQEFKRRLNKWRDKFKAIGGRPTSPELRVDSPVMSKKGILKLAAVGGGIAALVWYISK